MQLLVVKLLGLLGLSSLMLAGILLPVRLLLADSEKAGRYHRGLALGNCFGGGVFLATCFNALLPAVRDKAAGVLQQLQVSSDYPLAETMMMVGFFIMLFVEQAVLTFRKEKPSFIALETFNTGGSEPGSDSEYDAPFLGGGHRHGHFGPGHLAGAGPLRLAGLVLALSAHSLGRWAVSPQMFKPTVAVWAQNRSTRQSDQNESEPVLYLNQNLNRGSLTIRTRTSTLCDITSCYPSCRSVRVLVGVV
ncbi:PREDICTED: zinc transporter ZIP3-like [Poecilia mexicana]|uniref:zinc transporter ZIP3-like n=1 Tax=Poecilia mexicana TaxID=48701 RepID=UPI00072EC60E|nr:PREDICTED: zinc transporter ZIP3-like [Poecilia mexicana]